MKSSNILKVIENFRKVLPLATKEGHLRMEQVSVHINHRCGTVCCHGGWYAIAACDMELHQVYLTGANKMAKDLGLTLRELMDWTIYNPKEWGNPYGGNMFSHKLAFYHSEKRPEGANTLQDIVDHWTEVYERVKAKELLSEPPIDNLIEKALSQKAGQFLHAADHSNI